MTALVRSDALRRYVDLVSEIGADPAALLRKARLSPAALRSGDNFIAFRSMLRLLEISAEILECKDFGLRLAARQDMEMFGPIALAAQHCETLGEGLECFSKYFHTHNPGLQIAVSHKASRKTSLVSIHVLLSKPPAHTQFDERCVMLTLGCLNVMSSSTCRPLRVLLPHSRLSSAAIYRRYFDCELCFDQPLAAVEVATDDLHRRLPKHNPQLHRIATAFLENLGSKPHALLSQRVRETIRPLLTTGSCSHRSIAEALHMHERTLQRRLAEEGSSFEAIKDEVRRDLAKRYLTTSNIPLSQITALLGYSEQSALTRSCQRWFRCAPLALRQKSSSAMASD